NRSPDKGSFETLRRLNYLKLIIPDFAFKRIKNGLNKISFDNGSNSDKYNQLNQIIYKKYSYGNQWVAKKYFDRHELFV
ncbi:hypothetical protein, partial [Moorena sp. SIO4A1]|uniref:hypothetical protein n=1 Tax=Moorena sp. SIO4A1 TaxID=2607835 RepID=UPI0025FEE77D